MGNAWHHRAKAESIEAYGSRCFCCGENDLPFLTLDHVNNDGAQHRRVLREQGHGNNFVRIMKRLGWPNDPPLQVACWNCNMAKQAWGGCPHSGFERDVANAHPRTRHRYFLRVQAMHTYGNGECACCGENELSFLTLDHINGDGAADRRYLKNTGAVSSNSPGGVTLYQYLKNLDWPDKDYFQVLCANCNGAKRMRERCPHQEEGENG